MGMKLINGKTPKKTVVMGALLAVLFGVGSVSGATSANELLRSGDTVGMTFWIATAMMFAATIFFILERQSVAPKWRTSMTVAALVTGVAWYHYTYMREAWAYTYGATLDATGTGVGDSPLVLRYVDWLITVPLQVAEFYLVLAAVGAVTTALFFRLFGASLVMLIAGFLGEAGEADEMMMFGIGLLAWFYIIYEIWAGDAKSAADTTSEGTQFAFKAMAVILTAGWAIYPIGYFLGTGDNPDVDSLNILYNLADSVNKVAFGLMVWYAATMDSE